MEAAAGHGWPHPRPLTRYRENVDIIAIAEATDVGHHVVARLAARST